MKDKKLYIIIAILDVIAAALIIWHMRMVAYHAYANYYRMRDPFRLVVLTLGLFVGLEEKYINKGRKSTMHLFVLAACVNGVYLLNLLSHRGLEAMSDFFAGLALDSMVTGMDILFLVTFFVPAVLAVVCGIMAGLRAFKLNQELKEEDNENL